MPLAASADGVLRDAPTLVQSVGVVLYDGSITWMGSDAAFSPAICTSAMRTGPHV
jgi:hypothetical protein